MRNQLSSRTLALVAAAVNIVVCGTIVTLQFALRPEDPLASAAAELEAFPETVVVPEEPPPTTTTTTPGAEYLLVSGPGGMTTYIPASWPTKVATGPGAMEADDPANPRLLRYGGSATPVTDSYQVHVDYEAQFSRNKNGYVSLRLERTYVRDLPAIDWEFEYDAQDGRRHVRSVYWLTQGYEYFVYASAPVPLWPGTQEILDVMLDHSTP